MTARRGKKIEGGLAAVAVPEPVEAVVYVAGPRGLDFGYFRLTEGVEVPGASDWLRREAWENARLLRAVGSGEPFIAYDDFTASEIERLRLGPELELIEA